MFRKITFCFVSKVLVSKKFHKHENYSENYLLDIGRPVPQTVMHTWDIFESDQKLNPHGTFMKTDKLKSHAVTKLKESPLFKPYSLTTRNLS